MPRRTLLLAHRPFPLSLLRCAPEHARAGSGRLGLRSAYAHQLRAKRQNASTTKGIGKIENEIKNSTHQPPGGEHLEIP
jgi:hypothetical protein